MPKTALIQAVPREWLELFQHDPERMEEQLRGLFTQEYLSIVILRGPEFVIEYVNPSLAEIWGRRLPELANKPLMEALPELEGQGFDDLLRQVLKSGEQYIATEREAKLLRNGTLTTIYFNFAYVPMRDRDGTITGIITLANDVTKSVKQRKAAERKERQSRHQLEQAQLAAERERQHLHNLFMDAPSMIAVLRGPDHVIELANAFYLKATGTDTDIIGKSVAEALPEVVNQGFIELLDTVYRSGKAYVGNEILIKLDRQHSGNPEDAYFNFVYQPIRNDDDQVDGIFVQAVDVTELVLAKRAAEHSEERLELSQMAGNIGSFEWFPAENRFVSSTSFERLHGLSVSDSETTFARWLQQIRPDLRGRVEAKFRSSLSKLQPLEIDYAVLWPDGSEHWLVCKGSVHRGSDSEALSLIGACIDVTEIRQATATRRQLEEMILVNKTKDEFISLASHQLRTPATGVKQYLGMVLEGFTGELQPEQRTYLQTAYDSNERQLGIINQLLKTAQLDSGRYQITKSPIDLQELLQSVIDDFAPILALRHQKLVFQTSTTARIPLDAEEMKLVFSNLLENASKYSPEGTRIDIRLKRLSGMVCISFSDQGVGIAPEDRDKVFEKFTRINNALSDTVSGNGLGLYWVKQIIQAHNGTIDVESEVGKGSTFTVRLPA